MTPELLDAKVKGCVIATWDRLRKLYPTVSVRYPVVKYSNRLKTTAGRAFLREGYIELSTSLLWQHPDAFMQTIVPHELAHIVAYQIAGDEGHGIPWKNVMQALDLPPDRCHTLVNYHYEARKRARA